MQYTTHESFTRIDEVKARTGLSRSSIYLGIAQNTFPRPFKIGKRAVAWRNTDIDAWIASRIQASAE